MNIGRGNEMRRGLEAQKDRFAKARRSKLTNSQDEVGRWLGERLRAAVGEEMGEEEIRLLREASGGLVDKTLM